MREWEAEFVFPCAFCTEVAGGGMISGTLHKGTPTCSCCGAIAQVERETEPNRVELAQKVLGPAFPAGQAIGEKEVHDLVEFKVGEVQGRDHPSRDAPPHGWKVLWARLRPRRDG